MSDELQKALAGVRAEIDGIDAELLGLLNRRARCAQKVGEIKAEHGEAGHIYRPEREAQVLRRLQETNPGPLPGENITFASMEPTLKVSPSAKSRSHCLPSAGKSGQL